MRISKKIAMLLAVAVLALSFAAFFTACGGDGDNGGNIPPGTIVTPGTPDTPDTPTTPDKPEPVAPPAYEPCKHEKLVVEQKRPARCDAAGYERYWVCIGCGALFSDERGETQITEPTVIPATAHTPFGELVAGDATHYRECAVCGAECDEEAHDYALCVVEDEYLETAATATAPARYFYSCKCGAAGEQTFVKYVNNVAVGKPVTCDSATGAEGSADWGDNHLYGGIDYINDGDVMTRYNTAGGHGSPTVTVDLGGLFSLNGVTVCQYADYISSFKVYVCADDHDTNAVPAAAFTLAGEFTSVPAPNDCNLGGNNTREYTDHIFDTAVFARYVKVEFVGKKSNFTLWELGVYGYAAEYGELESIEVASLPRVEYLQGDMFDAAGLVVRARYANGSKLVTNYSVDKTEALVAADKTVTVSYTDGGVTKTADIEIDVSNKILNGISVGAAKPAYYGDLFDEAYTVTASYADGSTETVEDYTVDCNGPLGSADNGKSFTVSYEERGVTKTCRATVAVTEAPSAFANVAEGTAVTTTGSIGASGTADWGDNHLYGGLEYLTDGNLDSRVHARSKDMAYCIDLGNPFDVSQLGLSAFDKNPFTFTLSLSTDGESYTTVLENVAMRSPNDCGDLSLGRNTRDIVKFDFERTEARYVKLAVTASVNISLWEVLVYGELADLGEFTALEVVTPPTRTTYFVGDVFEPAGLTLRAVFEKGVLPVSEYAVSKTDALAVEDTAISVSCTVNGVTKSASVAITVRAITLTAVEATKAKDCYYGDYLRDVVTVTAVYSDESSAVVTDYTASYSGPLGSADNGKAIIIKYTENGVEKSVEYTPTVTEAPSAFANVAEGTAVTTTGSVGESGTATWGDNHLYGGLEYLTDGNLDSRVNAASSSPVYAIDLEGIYSLDQLGLSEFDKNPFTFTLSLSTDGESYTTVLENVAMRSPNDCGDLSLGRNTRDIVKFDFERTDARYVKLAVTASVNISLWEILVYGERKSSIELNVTQGKLTAADAADGAWGTATWGDGHLYGGLEYLTDGNLNSRYGNVATVSSVVIDLGRVYELHKISLCQYDSRLKSFKLYTAVAPVQWSGVWDSEWTLACEKTGITSPNDCNQNDEHNTRLLSDFEIAPVTARYVKIEFDCSTTLTVWELMIFGSRPYTP